MLCFWYIGHTKESTIKESINELGNNSFNILKILSIKSLCFLNFLQTTSPTPLLKHISHEIKRCLLLGRKAMRNLDSVLRRRDITLSTKVRRVKDMFFPVVMYRCESWTTKKAEHQRIDAFKQWRWRRLLRVPWNTRRLNQSILKEINPEYSLEGLILKLQYFGPPMENTPTLGKTEGRRKSRWQRMRWLDSIIDLVDMSWSKLRETVKDREAWHAEAHRVAQGWTQLRNNNILRTHCPLQHICKWYYWRDFYTLLERVIYWFIYSVATIQMILPRYHAFFRWWGF